MSSDPPELGKGLFGYRKSSVNQIIADRDIMLRQAEGRVRAAESKVAELESELVSMRARNSRMDEQLERLRQQLDTLVSRGTMEAPVETPAETDEAAQHVEAPHVEAQPAAASPVQAQPAAHTDEAQPWDHQDVDHEQPPVDAWEAQPAAISEPSYPSYGHEETPQAEDEAGQQWTGTGQEWPAVDEASPEMEADADEGAAEAVPDDDALPYGAEIKLRHDEPAERPSAAWMHTGPETTDQEERDEVAMAGGGYGFEGYDADEPEAFGEFGTAEEEGESPSPFSRFPFTSEHFQEEPEGAAEIFGEEEKEEEEEEEEVTEVPAPAYEAPSEPPPAQHAWEAPTPEPVAESAPPTPAVSQETADITNRFLTEELAGILAAAEESAARIVERGRATTQRQIARSNRVWRDVQAEVSRFASWRQEVEPLIRNVQSKVEGVRSEIEEVPERIRQALAPMADSMSSIDADLAELAAASNPPLLLAPGGLESEGSDMDGWDFDEEADVFGPAGESETDEGSGHLHAG
jgi:hypothetical protein